MKTQRAKCYNRKASIIPTTLEDDKFHVTFNFITDKDGYDIKKQEEVLQESLMMVPDCQRRLVKAFEELKNILLTEQDLKEIGDYIEAEKALKEAETQLPKEGEIMEMC